MYSRVAVGVLFLCGHLHAAELLNIPPGQVEAIWLSPTSVKSPALASKVFIDVQRFEAMKFPVSIAEYRNF